MNPLKVIKVERKLKEFNKNNKEKLDLLMKTFVELYNYAPEGIQESLGGNVQAALMLNIMIQFFKSSGMPKETKIELLNQLSKELNK